MKIINKAVTSLMTISLLTSLTSCATIMHGTRQSVGIASNPTNACVWVDRVLVGNTPVIVEMSRKDNHIVRIELDGYQPYEVNFTKQVSGWVFGNFVFGGLIGLAIDACTGGIYMLTPGQIQAELRANSMARSRQSKDSYITIVLEPKPSWQKVGNLVAAK